MRGPPAPVQSQFKVPTAPITNNILNIFYSDSNSPSSISAGPLESLQRKTKIQKLKGLLIERKRKAPKLTPKLILGTAIIQRPTLAGQIFNNVKKVRQCVVSVGPERTQTLKARKES